MSPTPSSLLLSYRRNPPCRPSSFFMAAILWAWLPLSLLLFSSSFLSSTAASASHPFPPSSPQRRLLQSNSPPPPPPPPPPPNRNIETFFPSLPSPAFPNLVPPPPPASQPFPQPPTSQPSTVPPPKSQDSKVATAVVATAASTFAVSGLLFFAFHRFSAKRRREARVIDSRKGADRQRSRANLGLKGVIVDENGLDAIYWREFDKEDRKRCRHCKHALESSGRQEEDNPDSRPRNDRRIQEAALIPPGSVDSSSRIFHEPRILSRSSSSTFSVVAVDSAAGRARPASSPSPPSPPSNISTLSPPRPPPLRPGPVLPPPPVMKANASPALPRAPAPPPPPPPPVMKANASPAPPSAPAPPPPPPPPQVMKANASPPPPRAPAPPPPPLGTSGAAGSSFRPPSAPAQASDGGPKKLKPLHWDKVNPSNADHSMVWDKISGGSFR